MYFFIKAMRRRWPRIFLFFSWPLMRANILKRFVFGPELLIAALIKKGDVIIDVGANTGQLTLPMAYLTGQSGQVYAFEPCLNSCQKLSQRVREARLLSVIKINQLALTDRRSQATLTIPRKRLTQASLRPHHSQDWENYSEGSSRYFTQSCQTITLDDFIFEKKLPHIDFLKCDVEGAELLVLKGAKQLLQSKTAPIILIEADADWTKSFGYDPKDIFTYLQATAGYEFYWLHAHGLEKIDPYNKPLPGIYWRWLDYLCVIPGLHNLSAIQRFIRGSENTRLTAPSLL